MSRPRRVWVDTSTIRKYGHRWVILAFADSLYTNGVVRLHDIWVDEDDAPDRLAALHIAHKRLGERIDPTKIFNTRLLPLFGERLNRLSEGADK